MTYKLSQALLWNKIAIFLFAFVLPITTFAQNWSSLGAMPEPAQEIYPAVVGSKIIVAGGFDANGARNTTLIFNHATGLWLAGPDLPAPRHHIYLVDSGENVLAIGGYEIIGESIWNIQAGVWTLGSDQNEWVQGPDLPEARAEGAVGNIGGTIVLTAGRTKIGERTGEREDHKQALDTLLLTPGANAWTRGAEIPTPRMSGAATVLNERLHVIGGRQHIGEGVAYRNLASHEAYDPKTDSWEVLAPMPKIAAGISAAVLDGKIYVFGGEEDKEPFTVYAYLLEYDPESNRWAQLPDMPSTRHGHGSVTMSDGIHVLGGSELPGGTGTVASHDLFVR